MMMHYIWSGMILFAVVTGLAAGRAAPLSDAIMQGGSQAVELTIKLLGMLCLWGGLSKIAEESGLTRGICRVLSPLLRLVFPGLSMDSPAAKAIAMNVSANLLGLGNAATPLGLYAMQKLQEENKSPLVASNHMIYFVVLNTASIQILPTTVAMMRSAHGSANPMEMMPAVWICSVGALCMGLLMARLLTLKTPKTYRSRQKHILSLL